MSWNTKPSSKGALRKPNSLGNKIHFQLSHSFADVYKR